MNERKATSKEIKLALAKYRPNDFFIPECKTDSTYFSGPQGLLIFDGLAITRSYTSLRVTGYEVKVSRGDFLRDGKYHLYLQYCNEFYFVVPAGMVKKEEIPDDIGLIYYYPETGKLMKKKRALYRQIEEPVGVYKYIIFSRLAQDRIPFYETRAEYAKDYLEDRAAKRDLGWELGSKMARDLSDAYGRLERLEKAEADLKLLDSLLKVMADNGIHCWRGEDYAEKLDAALQNTVDPDTLKYLEGDLQNAMYIVKRIKGKGKGPSRRKGRRRIMGSLGRYRSTSTCSRLWDKEGAFATLPTDRHIIPWIDGNGKTF